MLTLPPLSLYIHIPWCVKKCPYCDFNSHQQYGELPEQQYIDALLSDLRRELTWRQNRALHSIFIGGGTPSLFSAAAFQRLFDGIKQTLDFAPNIEITMEANPGTFEHDRFQAYREVGINRLSVGVQSFQDEKLNALGRIHRSEEAIAAIESLPQCGFDNFNIDLMHGLPQQSIDDALSDLRTAFALNPTHLSWYQLTIEPNTNFYSKPPPLPQDETLWSIQEQGQALLAAHGFVQYEISAYAHEGRRSQHNLNYWQFGDYFGIGAGAHGKMTVLETGEILRNWKTRMPTDYLKAFSGERAGFEAGRRIIGAEDLPIEFMMNALRLNDGVENTLYEQRTGQPLATIAPTLRLAEQKGLLEVGKIQPTETGRLFLNDLLELFA